VKGVSIMTAQELQNNIQSKAKEEKFQKMVNIQQKFIEENMKCGKNSVIWIFSDKEYFHNSFERQWFTEFNSKARRLFEQNGYIINGIVITW